MTNTIRAKKTSPHRRLPAVHTNTPMAVPKVNTPIRIQGLHRTFRWNAARMLPDTKAIVQVDLVPQTTASGYAASSVKRTGANPKKNAPARAAQRIRQAASRMIAESGRGSSSYAHWAYPVMLPAANTAPRMAFARSLAPQKSTSFSQTSSPANGIDRATMRAHSTRPPEALRLRRRCCPSMRLEG